MVGQSMPSTPGWGLFGVGWPVFVGGGRDGPEEVVE